MTDDDATARVRFEADRIERLPKGFLMPRSGNEFGKILDGDDNRQVIRLLQIADDLRNAIALGTPAEPASTNLSRRGPLL